MSSRTRYFLIASSLIVVVGLCTGLVAYYNGNLPTRGSAAARLPELAYVPADASALAYADVKDIMASQFRQKLRELMPTGDEKDRLLAETGIDIEHDIDSVLAGLGRGGADPRGALVLFRGRFDSARIEGLAAQHGAVAEQYKGKRLLVAPQQAPAMAGAQSELSSQGIAFLEPGLLAVGSADELRRAIDTGAGAAGLAANGPLMAFVTSAQRSGNAWIVGRLDGVTNQPFLPNQIREQLPAFEWFTVSADIDRGVSGVIRADAHDEQAGEQARGVVNGALSAARLLAGHDQRLDTLLNSLQVSGTGKTTEIAFQLAPEMLDMLKSLPMGSEQVPVPALAR